MRRKTGISIMRGHIEVAKNTKTRPHTLLSIKYTGPDGVVSWNKDMQMYDLRDLICRHGFLLEGLHNAQEAMAVAQQLLRQGKVKEAMQILTSARLGTYQAKSPATASGVPLKELLEK